MTTATSADKVITVRLPSDLHHRLKMRLAADHTTFQAKVEGLLVEYLDGPEEDRAEITRQVALAKEIMQQYAPAMRELAR